MEEIFAKSRKAWGYCVLEDWEDRKQLKEICERTLTFENNSLNLPKGCMLSELNNQKDKSFWLPLTEAVEHFRISEQLLRERIEKGRIGTKCEYGEQLVLIGKLDKILAASALGKVIYPDAEIVEALQTLESDGNEELQRTIKETLGTIQEVQGS